MLLVSAVRIKCDGIRTLMIVTRTIRIVSILPDVYNTVRYILKIITTNSTTNDMFRDKRYSRDAHVIKGIT